ncbi:flagellin [bacterium]|nr:flagellin [bacterium]
MSMVINTNTASLIAQQAQSKTNASLEQAMERLSTGKRINSAADDAAGMAMANRMESAVRGLTVAIRNAGDAQSLVSTAESAHSEVESMLQRMREIAVQAASDTNSASDRANLNKEVTQLNAEIDRIASQTSWGGQKLLDDSFTSKNFQVGMKSGENVAISIDGLKTSQLGAHTANSTAHIMEGTDLADSDTRTSTSIEIYGRDATETASFSAKASAKEVAEAVNVKSGTTGVSAEAKTHLHLSGFATGTASFNLVGKATSAISATVTSTDIRALITAINAVAGATGITASAYEGNNGQLLLTSETGDDIELNTYGNTAGDSSTISADAVNFAGTKLGSAQTITAGVDDTVVAVGQINFTATSAFTLDDAGSATTGYNADVSSSEDYISGISVTTKSAAASSLATIDGALEKLLDQRAYLGAISNRLDYTMSNLTEVKTNTAASKSRIEDADFAVETSNLTKAQILSQAATAMLAQANASKQSVLSLLQG